MDERQELHFTISYALWRARRHLPAGKSQREQRESYRLAVDEIIDHLGLSGYDVKKRPPPKPPSSG